MTFGAAFSGSVRNGIWILSSPARARISGEMPNTVPVTRPQTMVAALVTSSRRNASVGNFLRAQSVKPMKIAP